MIVWQPQRNTWASEGSASRNKGPIARALAGFIGREEHRPETILEVASGFGDHVEEFARHEGGIQFQPTEAQPECIEALSRLEMFNVKTPMRLNVLDQRDWAALRATGKVYDAVLNINMIHISPAESTDALFAGAASLLRNGGFIMLYGAYLREDGTFASEGDRAFDADLRERDPAFGLRDPREVDVIAHKHGFSRTLTKEMALNNMLLIWRYKHATQATTEVRS